MAEFPDIATERHDALPPDFFALILGPTRKYACGLYPRADTTLAEAESLANAEIIAHAGLRDGQSILELGCGWGSLSLSLARRFPHARITAVTHSIAQRGTIMAEAARGGLANLTVVTAEMNSFTAEDHYDRILSVEAFEHMADHAALLGRIAAWLKPDGRMYLHVVSHRTTPYRFERRAPEDEPTPPDFATSDLLRGHGLTLPCPPTMRIEAEWRWNGTHYQRTAMDWLERFDTNARPIETILRAVYGPRAVIWQRRWRGFLLATARRFGAEDGAAWGISHYRVEKIGE